MMSFVIAVPDHTIRLLWLNFCKHRMNFVDHVIIGALTVPTGSVAPFKGFLAYCCDNFAIALWLKALLSFDGNSILALL